MARLEELARLAGQKLMQTKQRVATAESCTGGLLAVWLTEFAGSSAWFERGWVTYSNAAKMTQLGVPASLLEQQGAVSKACVLAMAEGALAHSAADVSLAVSGIAGPGGAVAGKPVGSVWLAWGIKNTVSEAQLFHFKGARRQVRAQAAEAALEGLLRRLDNNDGAL